MPTDTYLELSKNPIRFEAASQFTNVFFDESNKQIFAVRSGGVMGVSVKGPDPDTNINFRMEDHGPVISIKFSPDGRILAVQRTKTSVEFANYNEDGTLSVEYSQSCRKGTSIIGFIWVGPTYIAFITDYGVEPYQVLPDRRTLKALKTVSASAQWFAWSAACNLALLASGHGTQLQPISFKTGIATRLARIELGTGRSAITDRDVTLALLRGSPAVILLCHGLGGNNCAEVLVYQSPAPGQPMKICHFLRLGLSGRFAINVLDDLIIVHHQASKSSLLFDIALAGDGDGHHSPIAPPKSFSPFELELSSGKTYQCELYSPNWVVFQPNIIIDAKLGCLWYIELRLESLASHITDLETCVQVLRRRWGGKSVLLRVLRNVVAEGNSKAGRALEIATSIEPGCIPLEQDDIYSHVLAGLEPEPSVLISYVRALAKRDQQPQHHLSELLVTTLVRKGKMSDLHQLIRHGAVADSKPLACLLLSLGNLHDGSTQLALDMLARLGAVSEIHEVLFGQGAILAAAHLSPTPTPRKLLDAAKDDPTIFHALYRHYRMRIPQDHRSYYDKLYSKYFASCSKSAK